MGQKKYFFKNRKNNARTKTKVFLDSNGHKLFRTIEKTAPATDGHIVQDPNCTKVFKIIAGFVAAKQIQL